MPHALSTVPALGAALIVAIALLADVRHDIRRIMSGRSVVLLGIASWFLLEAIALSPEVLHYDQSQYNFGVLCIVLATLSFLAGYHGTKGCKWFEPVAARVRVLDSPRMLWRLVVFCAIIGFAPILFYSGLQLIDLLHGIVGMRETWGGLIGRGRYGGFREAMLQLEQLVIGVAPFAVILLLDRHSSGSQRGVCIIVAVWPLLRAFGSGTRSAFLMAILPVLAILYFRSSPRTQRRTMIVGLCATPLLYGLMAAIVASRNSGGFSWEARNKATYVGNEMFQELLYTTSKVPESVPYQMGESYLVQLCAPIPRFLWPGKPSLDTGILMAELHGEVDRRSGQAYLTRSPGILGEMYLNFGLPGLILLNMFGGWLVRGWDRIPQRYARSLPTMVFYLVGLAALYFLGRSFSMQTLYPIGFFVAAVYLLSWIYRAEISRPRAGLPEGVGLQSW
jgi:oligosaccharide repeat unit polymerase